MLLSGTMPCITGLPSGPRILQLETSTEIKNGTRMVHDPRPKSINRLTPTLKLLKLLKKMAQTTKMLNLLAPTLKTLFTITPLIPLIPLSTLFPLFTLITLMTLNCNTLFRLFTLITLITLITLEALNRLNRLSRLRPNLINSPPNNPKHLRNLIVPAGFFWNDSAWLTTIPSCTRPVGNASHPTARLSTSG